MSEFRFDPPLTLKGNVGVRNLDDAFRLRFGRAGTLAKPTPSASRCVDESSLLLRREPSTASLPLTAGVHHPVDPSV
jgi:hypothetical protein